MYARPARAGNPERPALTRPKGRAYKIPSPPRKGMSPVAVNLYVTANIIHGDIDTEMARNVIWLPQVFKLYTP